MKHNAYAVNTVLLLTILCGFATTICFVDAAHSLKHVASPAVFYNVFLNSEADRSRVQAIVAEQLAMVAKANISETHITSIKVPIDSVPGAHMRHIESGTEIDTLSALFDFCKSHPRRNVIYLHAKGSFHNMSENAILRHFLTRGATSVACLYFPHSCHVCSSRFSPLPHPHTPGNMWLARCSYISKLIPPNRFEK
jgi:hypothetical protein